MKANKTSFNDLDLPLKAFVLMAVTGLCMLSFFILLPTIIEKIEGNKQGSKSESMNLTDKYDLCLKNNGIPFFVYDSQGIPKDISCVNMHA